MISLTAPLHLSAITGVPRKMLSANTHPNVSLNVELRQHTDSLMAIQSSRFVEGPRIVILSPNSSLRLLA